MARTIYTKTNMILAMHKYLVELAQADDEQTIVNEDAYAQERLDMLDKYPQYYDVTIQILNECIGL